MRRLPAVLALAALPLLGCGHSSGRQVLPSNLKHNLQVVNPGNKTLWVYVGNGTRYGSVNAASKGHIGKVHPGQTGYFRIERGKHKVYLRYRGDVALSNRSGRKFRLHFRTGVVFRVHPHTGLELLDRTRAATLASQELATPPTPAPPPGTES